MVHNTKKNLAQWLQWLESLHPTEIDLGLDRINRVAKRLLPEFFLSDGTQSLPFTVITVGGTNGKGSTIAFLQSILISSGYTVGTYTSPHFIHYNERIQINTLPISDCDLCCAFEQIELIRGDISLSYFEYGTLAAIYHFNQSKCDVIVLEVGLGGRLDAVNILDSDCSLVTTVDLDHQDWLGDNKESIGFEKAGIFRQGKVAIYGDNNAPESVVKYAREIGAKLWLHDSDFSYKSHLDHWEVLVASGLLDNADLIKLKPLKLPNLLGDIQFKNACNAIMLLYSLQKQLSQISLRTINQGILAAFISGRYQSLINSPGNNVEVIVDVAHNPQAARILKQFLSNHNYEGKTHAIFSILNDKDAFSVTQQLKHVFDSWNLFPVDSARAMNTKEIKNILQRHVKNIPITCYNDFSSAYEMLMEQINPMDKNASHPSDNIKNNRIIIFGSFFTVAKAMEYFHGS
jgi:dihydrofolate synthase / folylpolyglutamate synthase